MTPPTMFGLAEKEEEIWLPGAEEPIRLDHHTPELQLVQRVRNEAHRFGIIHHRVLRARPSPTASWRIFPGIGPERRKALLKAFGSLKNIREASVEDIAEVRGMTHEDRGSRERRACAQRSNHEIMNPRRGGGEEGK